MHTAKSDPVPPTLVGVGEGMREEEWHISRLVATFSQAGRQAGRQAGVAFMKPTTDCRTSIGMTPVLKRRRHALLPNFPCKGRASSQRSLISR